MAHSQSQSQSQAPQTSAQEASATSTPSPAASGLVNSSTAAHSPPSKRDLASWWRQFKRSTKKDAALAPQAPPSGIFGIPLNVSIKYANVAISLTGDDGKSFIYGYVPIVVAKCGVFLKEKATDVEGIFRLSGSAKRIKDLQEIFNSPDRFGKGLDWTGYTVHDAANILRRYLNQLPEPIVPLEFYERFREPLRHRQGRPDGEEAAIQVDQEHGFDREAAVIAYQQLIKELPPLNRQLLLYILDLLTVFASKSDLNRMTAANLAAIFQPGMLSHPSHDMSPQDYKLSQDVLVFLIENQDNFLFGMTGTAADAQTVQNIQGGMYPPPPLQKTTIRRSASNASGGADSLRKYEALRRNMSVSSRNSNGNVTGPSTPNSNSKGGGLQRSNTVPSKRAPGFSPSSTFARQQAATPPAAGLSAPPQLQMTPVVKGSPAQDITKVAEHPEPATTTTEQPENGATSTAEVAETAPATEAAAQVSLPVRNIEAALPEEPAKTTTEPAQAQPVESTKSAHSAEPARAPQLAEPFEFTKPPEPAPSPAPAPAPASAPAPAPASTPPGPDSTTQPATAGQPAPVEQSQPAQSSSTAHPIPKAQRPNHIDAPPPPQLDPATHKPTTITPTRERKLASLFSWTSPPSGERRDANKLKKKRRIPGSASESAQSSTASLPHGSQTGSDEATPTKQQQQPSTSQPTTSSNPEDSTVADESHVSTPKVSNPPLSPLVPVRSASTTQSHTSLEVNSPPHHHTSLTDRMLRPRSRTPSPNSHSLSATDQSDLEESSRGDKKDKRRSWRFHLGKKSDD